MVNERTTVAWHRHWIARAALTCVTVVGLGGAAMGVRAQVRLARCVRDLTASDRLVRLRAVEQAASDRDGRAATPLTAMLEHEQDREIIDRTANALWRLRDVAAVDVLRRRADDGPDDRTRADVILAAARVSGRDVRLLEWLQAGAVSSDPWCAMGSAVGLVELGRTEGGPRVIALATKTPPEVRAWGLLEFSRIAGPVAQTIGQPVAWLDKLPQRSGDSAGVSDAQLAHLQQLWHDQVDSQVLCDVLQRLRIFDRDWTELGRLLHARYWAARVLQ